jgi:2-keto-3-deoxy-L-rhamnonate aldolase RhmA
MLCPDRQDAIAMAKLGASAFMVSSDHGFLKAAARRALEDFAPPIR